MIILATCATKSYCYALPALLRRLHANLMTAGIGRDFEVFLAGDHSTEFDASRQFAIALFGADRVVCTQHAEWTESENYKPPVQLLIAQMRAAVVDHARARDASHLWFLDSDVLPPDNALRCSLDMLAFDGGYYAIAACPYPSQGGGSFLCGRGTPEKTILPDWAPEECAAPPRYAALRQRVLDVAEGAAKEKNFARARKASRVAHLVQERMKKFGPAGNVFEMNGKHGWRKRGWFDWAYPAIGRGAVVPTDWCGFGCTLLDRRAIAACDWSGYAGFGTEDLHVIWNAWHRRGLRIAAIPHCPASHVVRSRSEKGKVVLVEAYHEHEGECEGHLRQRTRPWYNHLPGEQFRAENDGFLYAPSTGRKP